MKKISLRNASIFCPHNHKRLRAKAESSGACDVVAHGVIDDLFSFHRPFLSPRTAGSRSSQNRRNTGCLRCSTPKSIPRAICSQHSIYISSLWSPLHITLFTRQGIPSCRGATLRVTRHNKAAGIAAYKIAFWNINRALALPTVSSAVGTYLQFPAGFSVVLIHCSSSFRRITTPASSPVSVKYSAPQQVLKIWACHPAASSP